MYHCKFATEKEKAVAPAEERHGNSQPWSEWVTTDAWQ